MRRKADRSLELIKYLATRKIFFLHFVSRGIGVFCLRYDHAAARTVKFYDAIGERTLDSLASEETAQWSRSDTSRHR
jgi:hypothetical protein